MSFDELPSDAQPPRSQEGEDAATDRETSASDAPPAAAPRRRRAQRTGTDAAPPESAVEGDTPARRRTPKKKMEPEAQTKADSAGAADTAANTNALDAGPTVDKAEGANAPAAEVTPPRRRRAAGKTAEEPAVAPDVAAPEPTPEAGSPRRQSRRKTTPQNEAAAPAAPVVEDSAAGEELAPAKASRRRSIRTPKDAAGAEPADAGTHAVDVDATSDASAADTAEQASATASVAETPPAEAADASSTDEDKPAEISAENAPAVTSEAASTDADDTAAPESLTSETLDPVLDLDVPPTVPSVATDTVPAVATDTVPAVAIDADANSSADGDTQAARAEPALSASEQAAAQDETEALPGRRSRQRTSRNRKRSPNAAANAPDTAAAQATGEAGGTRARPARAEQTTPENASSDTSPQTSNEEGPSGDTEGENEPRGRRRRNRRNNRGRRDESPVTATATGDRDAETTDEDAVSAVIVADLSGEAVVVPAAIVAIEEPTPQIDLNVGAHLIARNGIPQIHIDGKPFAPVLFFGNMEGTKNAQRVSTEVRRAAQSGVHLHSALVELPCPLSEASYILDDIDARLRALLDADPDGYVMPRLVFVPARGWKREYPTEISAYAEGTTGDPSLTSARFWQECERSLDMLITHIQSQTYGERVWGYHLERGEWFQSADGGYDRSTANRDAFRDWLREKYKHSLILLRAAWYESDVQFHTAEIPAAPGKPNPQRAFYETRRERNIIDFNEFTSESTANRLATLARAVKKSSGHNALVSVCYGYTFEFGHGFSGHLALDRLLASPHIDLITGPPSYRDRKPTGGASFPSPIDSPVLYGKLWLSEDDTKTYLAPAAQDPDDFNPRLADRFATEQAQARSIGRALATNTGVGWMDLWGEGWLDDEGLWERIGAFSDSLGRQQQMPNATRTPDVIALIDEKSLLHIQKGEPFFRKLTNGLRDTLQRSGASYGLYLQSDVLAPDFPTDARLYLFLTPFRLTAEQRGAIKTKLQRDNKTLAWLYAPGACEERPTGGSGMEEVAAGVVGITLRPQAWNSEVGSRILDAGHPLTERLGTRDLGTRERLNPSFYVDDPGATVLAEYQGSGLPSLAVRNVGSWKSVFVGDPILPLELLRGICRYAGVPLYAAAGEDIVTVGNGWVTVHAVRDGQRTLRLPSSQAIYDVQERRVVAEDTREYRYFLRAGMTRIFCVGTRARFSALNLPNLNMPTQAGQDTPERDETRPPARNDRNERNDRSERNERPEREPRSRPGREPFVRPGGREPQEAGNARQDAAEQNGDTAATVDTTAEVTPFADADTPPTVAFNAFPVQSPPADAATADMALPDAPVFETTAASTPTEATNGTTNENTATEANSAEEAEPYIEPYIEPFPEPRRAAKPAAPSRASAALRADLETLKAVLEMEMPADAEGAEAPVRPAAAPLPLPKDGVPGLDAILNGDSANRRRRRRGGRGRGRRPGEDDDDENAESSDGAEASSETEAE